MIQQNQSLLQQQSRILQNQPRILENQPRILQTQPRILQQPQGIGMHVMPPHGITQQPQKSPVVLQQPLVPLQSNSVVQVNNFQKVPFVNILSKI